MLAASQVSSRVAFGPFEVNTATGELTKNGVRIRLSGQPFNVLLALLASPGQLVRSDELCQKLWGAGTFVDFEHGLHSAINKVRRALGDSAESARYIETVPGMGYRFVGQITETPTPTADRIVVAAEGQKRQWPKSWAWWPAAAACVFSFVFGWQIHRWQSQPGPWKLTQLTSDAGLSYSPAISRDGTLVAYSSDRSGPGQLDLYVKQVHGDNSLRLTFDGLGNTTPDFSPDGSNLVFHSNRDGGGVYEIPTLGGQVRFLAKEGRNPKFSPDGSKIAYWIGGQNVASAVPGSGTVWVMPIGSGQSWQVGTNLTAARYPIWSPDSQGLLMVGYQSSKAYQWESLDWWFVSISGKRAIKTDIYTPLFRAGLQALNTLSADPSSVTRARDFPNPACWSAAGTVIFSGQTGDTQDLWETPISLETGKARGHLHRLTAGAANEQEPSCGGEDRIVFTSLQAKRNVWSAPFDLNAGEIKGALEQVTKNVGSEEHAALSPDGKFVAFASPQAGSDNIWLRELATGKQVRVAESPLMERFPVINPSSGKVAYSVYLANGTRSVYICRPGGRPEEVCHGCLRATDWSRDEKSLLVFGGNPYRVSVLDIASRRQKVLLQHEKYSLLYARYSPDNRWVSFTARIRSSRAKVMMASVTGKFPVPESEWTQIAEEGPEDWANWSPDGRTVYFTSARDGHFCVWGQRLDPSSRKPLGEAFAAVHLHGNASYQQGGWSAGGNRIAMVLTADSGNVWVLSRSAGR